MKEPVTTSINKPLHFLTRVNAQLVRLFFPRQVKLRDRSTINFLILSASVDTDTDGEEIAENDTC